MSDVHRVFETLFQRKPVFVTRAPGRVEFIGNHTDHNGGQVLGAAVNRFLRVGVAPREDGEVHFASEGNPKVEVFPDIESALSRGEGWLRYPLGVLQLLREKGVSFDGGFSFLVSSAIPSGAGLSSSAAFELASSLAFEELSGQTIDRLERVRLCRRAENEVVGVPCGILDQGVSGFGEENRLVHIDCADETIRTVAGPVDSCLWVFESGIKHSLVDSLYAERHGECVQAFEMIREVFPEIQFLAHVTPAQLDEVEDRMPEVIVKRARHVIGENRRVEQCVRLLEISDLEGVGRLLKESHWSSSKLFENSIPELDTLVSLLSQEDLVFGARLTGGGFGGAVMALGSNDFSEEDARRVADSFADEYGSSPRFAKMSITEGAVVEVSKP
ncbi:MAG: galactokinase [Verrucomicrobiota bacterium]